MNSVELREQRAKLIIDARKVLDSADADKRELTSEESASVDAMFADADKLEAKIDTLEKREQIEIAESRLKVVERKTRPTLTRQEEAPDFKGALKSWLLRGEGGRLNGAEIENATRCGIDLSSTRINLRSASGMGTAVSGSGQNAVGWDEFFGGYYDELKYYGPVLGLVSSRDSDTGNPLPIPITDDTANKAAIIGEGVEVSEALPSIGKVTLGAFKYESKEVPVTLELLQDSSFDLEAYIRTSLAERFGRGWNEHITKGAGTTEPFGIITRAGNSGVTFGGTASAPTPTFDDFLDIADSLDDSYRAKPKVGYMMHRSFLSKVRKLKDDNGQYLLQPSLQQGQSYTLNGYPVYTNPDMPTSGANARAVVFGDFSNYLWRRVKGVELFRLDQIRIRFGEIVFLAFARADGNLIQPNTVKYAKLAAS